MCVLEGCAPICSLSSSLSTDPHRRSRNAYRLRVEMAWGLHFDSTAVRDTLHLHQVPGGGEDEEMSPTSDCHLGHWLPSPFTPPGEGRELASGGKWRGWGAGWALILGEQETVSFQKISTECNFTQIQTRIQTLPWSPRAPAFNSHPRTQVAEDWSSHTSFPGGSGHRETQAGLSMMTPT